MLTYKAVCVCVCMCVHVCACVRACVHMWLASLAQLVRELHLENGNIQDLWVADSSMG